MKHLNTRFIISNIITAVSLFFSVRYYQKTMEELKHPGSAPVYGFFIIVAAVIGMVSMGAKSYDLAFHSRNNIRWSGRLFLILTYIGAFLSNIYLIDEGVHLGDFLDGYFLLLFVILIGGFVLLVLETHFLQHRPKKTLPKQVIKLADFGSMIYSSVGINLCWNHLIVGSNVNHSNWLNSLPFYVLAMIIFVFSFQRLFWYEIISDSETKKDNLKTALAILLVFVSGILPIYLY